MFGNAAAHIIGGREMHISRTLDRIYGFYDIIKMKKESKEKKQGQEEWNMSNTSRSERCRTCYVQLPAENEAIGVCNSCAEKEIIKLKKRIQISWIISILLVVSQIWLRMYVRANYVQVDDSVVQIPTLIGPMLMNSTAFHGMFFPSMVGEVLFFVLCFFLPFSQLTFLSFSTTKDQAVRKVFKLDPLTTYHAKNAQYNMDDAGMFVVALLLAVVAGPYWFVYRMRRVKKLEEHMDRKMEA